MSVQRLLEIEPMILDTACFHCQQAVEKYLKAFLIYRGEDIEKTHDVICLLAECKKRDREFAEIEPGNINLYAVRVRYPDMYLIPTKEEAENYYRLALQTKS